MYLWDFFEFEWTIAASGFIVLYCWPEEPSLRASDREIDGWQMQWNGLISQQEFAAQSDGDHSGWKERCGQSIRKREACAKLETVTKADPPWVLRLDKSSALPSFFPYTCRSPRNNSLSNTLFGCILLQPCEPTSNFHFWSCIQTTTRPLSLTDPCDKSTGVWKLGRKTSAILVGSGSSRSVPKS